MNTAQLSLRLIEQFGNSLTRAQLVIIQYLIQFGDIDLTQGELATSLKIQRDTVLRALKGLERLGLIERVNAINHHKRGLIRLKEEFRNVE